MKRFSCILFLLFACISCGQKNDFGAPIVNPKSIQSNFMNWWTYQATKIMLSRDYIALDASSQQMTKENFLNELMNGNYIPIQLESSDCIVYKLFPIEANSDSSIKATISQIAFDEFNNLKMEGKAFPAFSFKDLNGTIVSNETMKGKTIVIKCWYIHCAACIKEFPQVNALVKKYKDRNDVVFMSLAEDSPEQLKEFLAKKPLLYSVVPNMKKYMNETLELNAFPTHFIVDKNGLIAKVLTNYESLEVALEANLKKN